MLNTLRILAAPDLDLNAKVARRSALAACALLEADRRRLGQYFTPPPVAEYMASMVEGRGSVVRVLDPGAGVGSLLAALVHHLCLRPARPKVIHATAVEVDAALHPFLEDTLAELDSYCRGFGVRFEGDLLKVDYLDFAMEAFAPLLGTAAKAPPSFDVVITNPPYRKLASMSLECDRLRQLGVVTTNWYAAFLALSSLLLTDGGELVAITPRSFCNGTYFRAFRRHFLARMGFTKVHVIESRNEAFADASVLQENLIFRAVRSTPPATVVVSAGNGSLDGYSFGREIPYSDLVRPNDQDQFIHLPTDPRGAEATTRARELRHDLVGLGLSVSTGRVVDFRAREHLRRNPGTDTAPLLYPIHLGGGVIDWPKPSRKPNAIAIGPDTLSLLIPTGYYVLVKRFSAKEERRRIVASVYDPTLYPAVRLVGIENHLNFFHALGAGLDRDLAFGLAAFLNSTVVDTYFRQFSGHTQVNARDLRKLHYPDALVLRELGQVIAKGPQEQAHLDSVVGEHVWSPT